MELSDSIVRNSYIYRFVNLNCCVNLNKFASVQLSGSSCAAGSLTRSKRRNRRRELPPSMETPPDGYRRNVGICLVNPSKKVINFAICFIWIWFFAFQLNLWLGFMVLGVNLVDIYCFQDKHSVHVADASGSSYFQCWNLNSILFWGIWQELMRIGFSRYFSMWILNLIYGKSWISIILLKELLVEWCWIDGVEHLILSFTCELFMKWFRADKTLDVWLRRQICGFLAEVWV